MSSSSKNPLDYNRDPRSGRVQTLEFDPDGIALLNELFTSTWKRLTAWPTALKSHLLEFFKSR